MRTVSDLFNPSLATFFLTSSTISVPISRLRLITFQLDESGAASPGEFPDEGGLADSTPSATRHKGRGGFPPQLRKIRQNVFPPVKHA